MLVLIELNACVCSRVKTFEPASGMNFSGGTIPLANFWFVFEVMFADWSDDRKFWSVFKS